MQQEIQTRTKYTDAMIKRLQPKNQKYYVLDWQVRFVLLKMKTKNQIIKDLLENIENHTELIKNVGTRYYVYDRSNYIKSLNEKDWNRAEALGVIYNDESLDYKDWIVAQIDGKRVVIMKFSSPLYYWEDEKRLQATTAKSFRMLKFAKSFQHEMVPYDVTGYAEFMYPASWKLGTLNQSDFDRPSIRLINLANYGEDADRDGHKDDQKYSKGIISIQIVLYDNTGTSIADEVETQKNIAENMGIRSGKKLRHDMDIVFPQSTKLNMLEVYEGVSTTENNPHDEIWVAYMKNEEAYYFVTMLTPNRETRYFAWTENKSAFEAIVSSIEPISFYEE